MEIELLKRHWDALGRDDPLWAVLTEPDAKGGRWKLDEFLARGEHDVATFLGELDELGVGYERGRALDFGCGVGRLTQALADRFETCDGVDISHPMIEEARRINRHGERCRYHVNAAPNLELFDSSSFDFVMSFIVLQHMEPRYAKAYVAEFLRVLRPGGLALFQLPSKSIAPLPEALSDGGWRAAISVTGDRPRELRAGTQQLLRVRVRNRGTATWPADAHIRLGNHWTDQSGRVLVMDDARAELPGDLAPDQEATVELFVTAPAAVGSVRLELDLVQEGIGWFASRGSKTLRLPVTITPGTEELPDAETAFAPHMEMHAVPREEVLALVQESGGQVLHALPDIAAGSGFESFRYVVRRTASADRPVPRQSLEHLDAAVAAIPDRWDMLPPVMSRRRGRAGELERLLKRAAGKGLRWLTWAQTEHDRAVVRALREARGALDQQDAELRRLREEIARLRAGSQQRDE